MSDIRSENSLEDQLLIAMPQLSDPWFANSVTYLWKHSAEGALGIVINKPTKYSLADIFAELKITCPADGDDFSRHQVLAGGPVERDKGFIIHDSSRDWGSSIRLRDHISLSTSRELLQDIADGTGPENYVIALGCAGWDAGQLERELSENAWLTTPATEQLIFSRDFASKAAMAAAQLGISLDQLSPEAGHS